MLYALQAFFGIKLLTYQKKKNKQEVDSEFMGLILYGCVSCICLSKSLFKLPRPSVAKGVPEGGEYSPTPDEAIGLPCGTSLAAGWRPPEVLQRVLRALR
jgi:hypothetical protein